MKKAKILLSMAMVTIMLLSLIGCAAVSSGTTASNAAQTTNQAPTQATTTATSKNLDTSNPVRFACVGPFTGNNKQYGDIMKAAMQVALEKINGSGGVLGRQLVLDYYDDRDDAVETVNVANMIIDAKKYAMVVGNYASTAALPSTQIYQAAGLPYLGGCASHSDLAKVGNFIWRTAVTQATEGYYIGKVLVKEGYKKVAIIYMNNDWGLNCAKNTKVAFEKLGGSVASVDGYIIDSTKDFTPLLSKVEGEGVDCVFLVTDYAGGGQMLVQAKKIGMKTPIYLSGLAGRKETIDIAGAAATGIKFASVYPWGYDGQEFLAFSKRYQEVKGATVSLHAFYYYNNLTIAAQAVNYAGSTDPQAIIKALGANKYWIGLVDTWLTFNKDRQFDFPYYVCQVQNDGTFKYQYKLTYDDIKDIYESSQSASPSTSPSATPK